MHGAINTSSYYMSKIISDSLSAMELTYLSEAHNLEEPVEYVIYTYGWVIRLGTVFCQFKKVEKSVEK
jgi:hypothetical protein